MKPHPHYYVLIYYSLLSAITSSASQWPQTTKTIEYNYPLKEEPVSSPSPGVEVIAWSTNVTSSGSIHQGNMAVEDFLHQSQHVGLSNQGHVTPGTINSSGSSYGPGHFPCETCGKVYRYKGNLSSHVRLECGKERQFQCPHCPHKSKQKIHLIRHIRSKHQGNQQHAPPVMGLQTHGHHQNVLPHSSLTWHPHIPPPQVMLQVAASTQVGESALDHQRDAQQQQQQSSNVIPSPISTQLQQQTQQSHQQQQPPPSQQTQPQQQLAINQQQQGNTPSQSPPQQLPSPSPYAPNTISRATTP
ncbi:Longitudinals lacking protein, isoforms A/B/D/L [Frankliniella fusca]|uniref:Longitudinals lacking protein, isoforms A/B/D/L n=1 Tax=Frankliniella fusca TaxID=407009 RepID=A0AAE1LCY2_9NEOP|nr:Longitudinals lacking protein, isoforms A/B/D/L [Frankliniella fusca]